MLDIEYNQTRASDLGIRVRELPSIPAPERIYEEIQTSGGVFMRDTGRYEPKELRVVFNYIGSKEMWHEKWLNAKKWLSGINGELMISTDLDHYLNVKRVTLSDNEMTTRRVGIFEAIFHLEDAIRNKVSGRYKIPITGTKELLHAGIESYPVIVARSTTGNVQITVNGKQFSVRTNQEITIDTKKQLITYVHSGETTVLNQNSIGDFNDLILKNEKNIISCTQGTSIDLTPNWRCL